MAVKELAETIESLQKEISLLKRQIAALESQLRTIEAKPDVSGLERRVLSLEQAGTTDIYRELGIPKGQTLEYWHRETHRTDSRLKTPTQRDFENWHLRDHQRRNPILRRQ